MHVKTLRSQKLRTLPSHRKLLQPPHVDSLDLNRPIREEKRTNFAAKRDDAMGQYRTLAHSITTSARVSSKSGARSFGKH